MHIHNQNVCEIQFTEHNKAGGVLLNTPCFFDTGMALCVLLCFSVFPVFSYIFLCFFCLFLYVSVFSCLST